MPVAVEVSPFRMFPVRLSRRERRSPSLVRLTFTDPSLTRFGDRGYDQRIKLVVPRPGGLPLRDFPIGDDWFSVWRDQPAEERAFIRTYTIVAVRPERCEIDVDFVDHGATGPGSRFAVEAQPGDEAIVFGPNADFDGDAGGLEFRREYAGTATQLVVGDLSALPAINGIAGRLPADATGLICIEVPHAEDASGIEAPHGVDIVWCVTDRGDDQVRAVRGWLTAYGPLATDDARTTVIDDGAVDTYWEVTDPEVRPSDAPSLSAWIAGESGQVRALRRLLVNEFEVPKGAVSFMGYWRIGVAGS
ncbi:siderophore-interacting protein [Flexivirga endophytica]|uniref:Siderophore-interacting protein n=1 Tax=Flexivirga endophytica TaxID=1849103 RepID=A0A916TJI7_9MICO|nr:siderophore-interacting protein [Flexivirga endophytica]GGB44511.1 siderophore-interacting protein [Flexivirga endophytica]GHB60402.1 siderophore-interacting protein [Flexivirga endophytica]